MLEELARRIGYTKQVNPNDTKFWQILAMDIKALA